MIYLTVPGKTQEDANRVAELFRDREGIAAIIAPAEFGKYGLPQPQDYAQMADLILVAKDGYGINATAVGDDYVITSDTTLGTHGFLSTNPKMNATFIASGAGVREGVEIGVVENIDVAPTIAKLLGVSLPTANGKPIDQALAARVAK